MLSVMDQEPSRMNQGYGVSPGRLQRGVTALFAVLVLMLSAAAAASPVPKATAATSPARTVLVLGDSLSAGYGLSASQGWVALMANRMARSHPQWKVVNASVSGETTAGGAARIAGELKRHRPAVVVVELGANDGLRGLPLAQTRANLEAIIRAARRAGARVLVVGMRMPPNFGPAYTRGFEANYRELSKQYQAALLPFLLEPIAANRANFQADNLHPTAAAQPRLRDHVWPALAPLLR
jgi:acyl-CoA thioesterase-1